MSNMSYIRFENTLSDLQDCVYQMEESEDSEKLCLSRTEKQAADDMFILCEQYMVEYKRLFAETEK